MSESLLTLDTNVLIYSVDKDAGVKQYQALEIVERAAIEQTGVLTLQALSEFYFAVVRKGKMPADDAKAQVEDWQILFPTIVPSAQTLANALKVVHEHSIQFWDAMVWAVSKENGVKILLSEDFQHGRVLGGVRFVNPFLETAGVAEPMTQYTATEIVLGDEEFDRFVELGNKTTSLSRAIREAAKHLDDEGF